MSKEGFVLGYISWFNSDRGFGVVKSLNDKQEYFLHISKLSHQYSLNELKENTPIIFIPTYNDTRQRSEAKKAQFIHSINDVIIILSFWIQKSLDLDLENYVIKALSVYLSFIESAEATKPLISSFIDLITLLLEYKDNLSLFTQTLNKSIQKAYQKDKANSLIEILEVSLLNNLSESEANMLVDGFESNYSLLYYCFLFTDKTDIVLNKLFEQSNVITIIDDLIRLVININDENEILLLKEEKKRITDSEYCEKLNGYILISKINNYIFTILPPRDQIIVYLGGYISKIDIEFIKRNIMFLSSNDIITLINTYHLKEDNINDLLIIKIDDLLCDNSQIMPDPKKYEEIKKLNYVNADWVAYHYNDFKSNDEAQNKLRLWLYKNGLFTKLDENFIIYFIEKLEVDDIISIVSVPTVTTEQSKKIFSATFIDILGKIDIKIQYDILGSINNSKFVPLSKILNKAKEQFNNSYDEWYNNLIHSLTNVDQFYLWVNRIINEAPIEYLKEEYLNDIIINNYNRLKRFYMDGLLTLDQTNDILWYRLHKNDKLSNRTSFNISKIIISILIEIDRNNIEIIKNEGIDVYNLILWIIDKTPEFDYDTLCKKFILLNPDEQAYIIKKLFKLKAEGLFELTIEKLDQIIRIDSELFHLIYNEHPCIPIDVSTEIVIKALVNLSRKGSFISEKEVLDIIINSGKYYKKEVFQIGKFFDKCKGRIAYRKVGIINPMGIIKKLNNDYYSVTFSYNGRVGLSNNNFSKVLGEIKSLEGSIYYSDYRYWAVPSKHKSSLITIAKSYNLFFEGEDNSHLNKYIVVDLGTKDTPLYCEGRPSLEKARDVQRDFLWCRNSRCFNSCVKPHDINYWKDYTLLDFSLILGLNVDDFDRKGYYVKYGKYLAFSSIINRAYLILKHLYCRECSEMLVPTNIGVFAANLVVNFHCDNNKCSMYNKDIYLTHCFNGRCYGVIDARDSKKCPNQWQICPVCGSCCSNRTMSQRINNLLSNGIQPSISLYNFVQNKLGHLEKREFYCYVCGNKTYNKGNETFECPDCGVVYERYKYDYIPSDTRNNQV